jgi:CRISPR-associated protein Cmr3
LRGNQLFGGPGDHGEALMPPWPSLAAGALRARMLADHGRVGFCRKNGENGSFVPLEGSIGACLGTPDSPGSFRLSLFTLARRAAEGGAIELLFPLPADLMMTEGEAKPRYVRPTQLDAAIATSAPLPQLPLLRQRKPAKPRPGLWLTARGFSRYLDGRPIEATDLAENKDLWKTDSRLGIALDADKRTAAEGQLYTVDAVAPAAGWRRGEDGYVRPADTVGFLVGIDGADDLVPQRGLLRFGGDGRAAEVEPCDIDVPQPPWEQIGREKRFRLILASPGLFDGGWRPPGVEENGVLRAEGLAARLVAAAVPRAQVISGWDIARWRPKAALRAAPTGAVYWFDELEGELGGLKRLPDEGFWAFGDGAAGDWARAAEGFNRVLVGAWAADRH